MFARTCLNTRTIEALVITDMIFRLLLIIVGCNTLCVMSCYSISPPPPCYRHGAVELEEEERKRQEERSAAFQGSGFRLGDSEGPSSVVTGAQPTTKPVEKVLSLYMVVLPPPPPPNTHTSKHAYKR